MKEKEERNRNEHSQRQQVEVDRKETAVLLVSAFKTAQNGMKQVSHLVVDSLEAMKSIERSNQLVQQHQMETAQRMTNKVAELSDKLDQLADQNFKEQQNQYKSLKRERDLAHAAVGKLRNTHQQRMDELRVQLASQHAQQLNLEEEVIVVTV